MDPLDRSATTTPPSLNAWEGGEEGAGNNTLLGGVLANPKDPLRGTGQRSTWIASDQITYGNLDPDRVQKQEALTAPVTSDLLLSKIWAVFRRLGFDSMPYLNTADRVTLCFVEKYVKFRQGEIWLEIQQAFQQVGVRPTTPDRERLQSGVELSEHLAEAVRRAQLHLQGTWRKKQEEKEAAFVTALRKQSKLVSDARANGKDRPQLTLTELREAKKKKEAMLKSSMSDFKFMGSVED
mmetsp:Transcript_576/g.718  ORF Transcript_576/g.718 Transcript_576/m.718 type:complete len:238 (+) Transcript_576:801-1514(+)